MSLLTDVIGYFGNKNAITRAGTLQLNALDQAKQDLTSGQGAATASIQGGEKNAQGSQDTSLQNVLQANDPYAQMGANASLSLSGAGGTGSPVQLGSTSLAPTSFNFDPSSVLKDPSFQYTIDQAMQALNRKGAGMGARTSGGTAKEELTQATGLASKNYSDAFNRTLGLAQTQFTTASQENQRQYQVGNEQNVQQYQAGQENQANQFNRNLALSNAGQQAVGRDTTALTNYGNQTAGYGYQGANTIANTQLSLSGQLANADVTAGNVRAGQTLGQAGNTNNLVNSLPKDLTDVYQGYKLGSAGT